MAEESTKSCPQGAIYSNILEKNFHSGLYTATNSLIHPRVARPVIKATHCSRGRT